MSADVQRLTVNIPASTKAALDRVVEHETVTTTEALRRLVALGDLVYGTVCGDGELVVRRRGTDDLERLRII
ncbi:hypothetical protein BC739_003167 [Kutzneria viridogrisea]|uniref:Uncharacterized protein n=1 Tax=Kutzneria viridogrisea TaxID=47990 RepID=A0ABR6BGH1_9PSEU|nr:hypothetical protein [Kutzneria viridogrisea]